MTASDEPAEEFIDSVEGEIAFFRSVMRTRPVGIHRHFHALAIRNAIQRETGRWVPMEDIWRKLRECYDLDLLESLVRYIITCVCRTSLMYVGNRRIRGLRREEGASNRTSVTFALSIGQSRHPSIL